MQLEHEGAADHVPGGAIGLIPTPGLAEFDRQTPPAQPRMLVYEPLDETEMMLVVVPSTEPDRVAHEPEFRGSKIGTPDYFSLFFKPKCAATKARPWLASDRHSTTAAGPDERRAFALRLRL